VIQRILAVGLLAGIVAGLAIAALQHVATTPLILAAEAYETPRDHAEAPAEHGWKPTNGAQRTASTSVATIAVSTGYALILLALMLAANDAIEPKRALAWGACAFAATGLATSLGLAPQLPGAAESDLLHRQVWWIATALLTGAGLFALLRVNGLVAKLAGAVAIAAPHVFGAPQPAAPESAVPAELAARFAAASLTVQAMTWILAGLLVALLWRLFAERAAAQPKAAR
jgi:cobalt transporter subunit CbtA